MVQKLQENEYWTMDDLIRELRYLNWLNSEADYYEMIEEEAIGTGAGEREVSVAGMVLWNILYLFNDGANQIRIRFTRGPASAQVKEIRILSGGSILAPWYFRGAFDALTMRANTVTTTVRAMIGFKRPFHEWGPRTYPLEGEED